MLKRFSPWLALGGMATLAIVGVFLSSGWQRAVSQGPKDAQKAKEVQGDTAVTPSRVVAVTVYPLNARVTREAEVPAGKGVVEVTINPLPQGAVLSSLHAEGAEGLRVLSTRFRSRTVVSDNREEVQKLQDELAKLTLAREKIEADAKAVQENLKTLSKMEGSLGLSPQVTEKAVLNAEAAITLAKYIKESRLESTRELVKVEQEVKGNQAKAAQLQARLGELSGGKVRTERDAVIVVDRANGAGGKVLLHYLVEQATWRPQYKLQAGKAANDPVQIEFLAGVVQNSGEEWGNVNLVLSTAQPMLNASPPDLQMLRVSAVHPASGVNKLSNINDLEAQVRNLRNKAQKECNESRPGTGFGLFNAAATLDQSFELHNSATAIQRGCPLALREGVTVTYRVANPLTVASRLEEQVIEVARAELKPDFYYKSVPLITMQVYRLADFVNKTDRVILPGEATMYIGADFVGQMTLPMVAANESFTVGFGVDAQMQVTRQLVNRGHTTQGGNQTLRYEYRSVINNFKNEKVKLQVWDRLPRPENDSVTVSVIKTTPEISKDPAYLSGPRTQNILRWDITAEPNTSGEKATTINYEYKMELDRNMSISDLLSGDSNLTMTLADKLMAGLAPADLARMQGNLAKLSPADQVLAKNQFFCAIKQEARLGAVGPIQKVVLGNNQACFFCCKGCENEARANPQETLQKCQAVLNRMNQRP
jgi:uncharacterized protein (TIGR02231 family)